MSWMLRVILVLTSVMTCFWILRKIRKSQVRIEDSVFWLLFSLGLILLSLFPQLASWAANLIGVVSPVNFVFLSIIFVLMLKLFLLSIKTSQQEHKLQSFVQNYAIREKEKEDFHKMETGGQAGPINNSPFLRWKTCFCFGGGGIG